jgi:hypothetical protein
VAGYISPFSRKGQSFAVPSSALPVITNNGSRGFALAQTFT